MEAKRYFIAISYEGTPYHGWQIQPNAHTVQAELNAALATYFRQEIDTLGCGRTDTGVHARQFYAHLDLQNIAVEKVLAATHSINALLPMSIAVQGFLAVADDAHARFDALERAYEYHIHFEKDPFKVHKSLWLSEKLELEQMNLMAHKLLNYTDFSCFSKSNTQTFTNNCVISKAYFEPQSDGSLIFHIQANRFLRNMVRAIVGTLLEVGRNRMNEAQFDEILQSKNRSKAGQSVAACGLYLSKIIYPYIDQNQL